MIIQTTKKKNKLRLAFHLIASFIFWLPISFITLNLIGITAALINYGSVDFDALLSTTILLASLKRAILTASIMSIVHIAIQWSRTRGRI